MQLSNMSTKFYVFLVLYLLVFSFSPLNNAQTVEFVPEKANIKGDVATQRNTNGYCTNTWLSNMPAGSIILGVNPCSCDPKDWNSASAMFEFSVPEQPLPLFAVLRVIWPDKDGKGIYSPDKNRKVEIKFDGQTIWSKLTKRRSASDDYYAAEHEPIQTTIVLKTPGPHTLTFHVPARTAWSISRIELIFYPLPTGIKGIGYSPYRDCQYPGGGEQQPSIEEIKEDLFILSHTCNTIRTYSTTGINNKVPAIAKSYGLKVFAGAWIDGNFEKHEKDDEEVQALIKLANTIDLDGVIVGNEYSYRHKREPDAINYLRNRIIQVKKGIKSRNIPVTTATNEDLSSDQVIKMYSSILQEIDGLLVHIYPFWENKSINSAADTTIKKFKKIQHFIATNYPGQDKFVIIGETGWPSNGELRGEAKPSLENQRRYLREFLYLADQEKVDYMYFDAFDELWKIAEGLVGQNWGYSYSDRTAKHNFFGVLLPPDLIPENSSDTADATSTLKFITNEPNIFKVYSEWPLDTKKVDFKFTPQSLVELKKINIPDTALKAIEPLMEQEFDTEQELFEAVYTRIERSLEELKNMKSTQEEDCLKLKSILKQIKNALENPNDEGIYKRVKEAEQGYNSREQASNFKNLILQYSKYHYFLPRFMGDWEKIRMFECDRCTSYSGKMSTRISFAFDGKLGWGGIYWLPKYEYENDKKVEIKWEDLPGVNIYKKMNLDKHSQVILTFCARGEQGGEKVQFKVGGVKKRLNLAETKWLTLDKEWKKYSINLSKQDLSGVTGGFCWVTRKDKNPGKKKIQIYLDDIQYELRTKDTPYPCNLKANILESNSHLIQLFGDSAFRNTNLFEKNYNGMAFSGEIRIIVPRFSKFIHSPVPLPDLFFTGMLKTLKNIDWEDRWDYGVGLEWRPFSQANFLESSLFRWMKQLRFYTVYLRTAYLQDRDKWSWKPRTDFRAGVEFYNEYNLYDENKVWAEIWADASWRKSDFYTKDYKSWRFAAVPKFGLKLFREKEFAVMPYVTGEIAWTERSEFWQNRLLAGVGIRIMPFRWHDGIMSVFIKGLRFYAESLWILNYFNDKAPSSTPNYDFRIGIIYTINWW